MVKPSNFHINSRFPMPARVSSVEIPMTISQLLPSGQSTSASKSFTTPTAAIMNVTLKINDTRYVGNYYSDYFNGYSSPLFRKIGVIRTSATTAELRYYVTNNTGGTAQLSDSISAYIDFFEVP